MKNILFISLFFMGQVVQGQPPKKLGSDSDTAFWYPIAMENVRQIGLRDLLHTSDSLYFRLWIENQAIEIWTNDYSTFDGIISNHVYSLKPHRKIPGAVAPGRCFFNKTRLSKDQAKKVYELFNHSGVLQIPSDKYIKAWQQGNDGEVLFLEIATKRTYGFKTYWTPSVQHNVPEARSMDNLYKKLQSLLDLQGNWDSFIKGLPKGCYGVGEMMIECIEKDAHSKKH